MHQKNPGQHFQVTWYGSSAGAQPLPPDLSLLLGHKGACSLQGLAGRAKRRGATPLALISKDLGAHWFLAMATIQSHLTGLKFQLQK